MNQTNKPFLATSRTESLRRLSKVLWVLWGVGLIITIWLFAEVSGFLGVILALLTFMMFMAALVASLMLKASRHIDAASTANTRRDVIDQ